MKKIKNNSLLIINSIKINTIVGMQYKAWFYANYGSILITIIVLYYFWNAIAKSSSDFLGYNNVNELTTYIIIANILIRANHGIPVFVSEVKSGNFSIHLTKPYNLFVLEWFKEFFAKMYNVFIIYFPIYVFGIIFLHVVLPKDLKHALGFILILITSTMVAVCFEILIGMYIIILTNSWGLIQFKNFVVTFFSGALVPLALFPKILYFIANVLPFKTIVSMPVNYYIDPSNTLLLATIKIHFIWSIIFIITAVISWKYIVKKRIVVMGG